MMSIRDWSGPPHRPGLRYSDEARRWAGCYFPATDQQIAAVVGGILCEQTGAQFSDLDALGIAGPLSGWSRVAG